MEQLRLELTPPESEHLQAGSAAADSSAAGPAADVERLRERLNGRMRGRLGRLRLTANRSTILSTKSLATDPSAVDEASFPSAIPADGEAPPMELRIHRCFLDAPPEVLDAVADYASKSLRRPRRRRALERIRRYFDRFAGNSEPAKRLPLDPVGAVFDLREIRDDLLRRFFDHGLEVGITWGRSLPRRRPCRQRSVLLGSYCEEDRLIRVHRVLDDDRVPRFVVESVVHHELLHAAMPPQTHNGRRRLHPPEFRRRERELPHLDAAEAWLDANLFRLLEQRRRSNLRRR